MANIALATEFLNKFRSESQALSERIASAPKENKQVEKESFLSAISKLRKDLIDANPYLPTYDQRTSELQLKALEKQLDDFIEGSTGVTGKARGSKFSFKRSVQPSLEAPVAERTIPNPKILGNDHDTASGNPTKPTFIATSAQDMPEAGISLEGESQNTDPERAPGFHGLKREFLTWSDLKLTEGHEDDIDISFSALSECIVNMIEEPGSSAVDGRKPRVIRAFHAKGLRRCIIMLPNVQGSALIRDCEDCIIAVSCYQFRIHTSTRVDAYLRVTSTPVIEKCTGMRFAPYTLPQSLVPVEAQRENQFANVQDFSWIRTSASPNWSLLGNADRVQEKQWPLVPSQRNIDAYLRTLLSLTTESSGEHQQES